MMTYLPNQEEEQSYIYPSSSFKYKQNQFNHKKGFLINYGKRNRADQGYNINLNLISADLEIIEENGVIVSSKGFRHFYFSRCFLKIQKNLFQEFIYSIHYTQAKRGHLTHGGGF